MLVLVSSAHPWHCMLVNVTHVREMQKQAAFCWSGWYSQGWDGILEVGACWLVGVGGWAGWGAELIDPQLQVAVLENTAEHSETCPDYQANCIHTNKTAHMEGAYARAIIASDRCTDLRR